MSNIVKEMETMFENSGELQNRLVMLSERGDECSRQQNWEQAEAYYMELYQLVKKLYLEQQDNETRELLANACGRMTEVCRQTGRLDEAEAYAREYLAVCQEWGQYCRSWDMYFITAIAYHHLGIIYQLKNQPDKAEEYYLQALMIRRRLYPQKQTPEILNAIAVNCHLLMELLLEQNRFKAANSCGIEMYEASCELGNEAYMNDALKDLFMLAIRWASQSEELIKNGRFEEAVQMLHEAREVGKYVSDTGRTIYDENGEVIITRVLAAEIQRNLAVAQGSLGHVEQALQAALRSANLYNKLWTQTGYDPYAESSANSWKMLADIHLELEQPEQAIYYLNQEFNQWYALYEKTKDIHCLPVLAENHIRLGNLYVSQMDEESWKEAENCFQVSDQLLAEHYKQTNDMHDFVLACQVMLGLGHAYWNMGRFGDAKVHYEYVMDLLNKLKRSTDFNFPASTLGVLFHRIAIICEAEGNHSGARAYFEGSYEDWKRAFQEVNSEGCRNCLAQSAFELGKRTGDRALLKEAYDHWNALCVQYPEKKEYFQQRQAAAEALM